MVSVGGAVTVMVSVSPVGEKLSEAVAVPESDEETVPKLIDSLAV